MSSVRSCSKLLASSENILLRAGDDDEIRIWTTGELKSLNCRQTHDNLPESRQSRITIILTSNSSHTHPLQPLTIFHKHRPTLWCNLWRDGNHTWPISMFIMLLLRRRGRKYAGMTCRNETGVPFFFVQLKYRFAIMKTTHKLLICVDKTSS